MALPLEELNLDGEVEGEEMLTERAPLKESRLYRTSFPGAVRKEPIFSMGKGITITRIGIL